MRLTPASASNLEGFGLTTAKIIYHLPDHRDLLQEFLWQQFDLFPQFPELAKFLAFWEERLDGPLHSVTVAHNNLLQPTDLVAIKRRWMH